MVPADADSLSTLAGAREPARLDAAQSAGDHRGDLQVGAVRRRPVLPGSVLRHGRGGGRRALCGVDVFRTGGGAHDCRALDETFQ